MKTIAKIFTLAAAGGMLLTAGCINHSETVTNKDPERVRVEFQNERAGRVFFEALSKMPYSSGSESSTEVSIPVIFDHKYVVKAGDNAKFNEAVKRCDTNKDGAITEAEADIFASQFH